MKKRVSILILTFLPFVFIILQIIFGYTLYAISEELFDQYADFEKAVDFSKLYMATWLVPIFYYVLHVLNNRALSILLKVALIVGVVFGNIVVMVPYYYFYIWKNPENTIESHEP